MDAYDRKILAELQRDGRISVTDLAARVGLSLPLATVVFGRWSRAGVIRGYRAELDPAALGLGFSTIVFVTLKEGDKRAVEAFEKAVVALHQVVRAQRLFGDPDYLLQVLVKDLSAFQRLYDAELSSLPGVQRLTSTTVMKQVVAERPLFHGGTQ